MKQRSWIQASQSNYMTRMLTDTNNGQELTQFHLNAAMNILEQNCIVGLYNDLFVSISTFERSFHWLNDTATTTPTIINGTTSDDSGANFTCVQEVLKDVPNPNVALESEIAKIIKDQNLWDIQLYQFAQELYRRQKSQQLT